MKSLVALVLGLAVAVSACGGKEVDLGYDDTRSSHPDLSAAVDLNAIAHQCAAPDRAAEPFTMDSTPELLYGRWFLCESDPSLSPPAPRAIEFAAGAVWYELNADASGVYVRGDPRTFHWGESLRWGGLYLEIDGWPEFYGAFRRGPLELRWYPSGDVPLPRPVVARFVKG